MSRAIGIGVIGAGTIAQISHIPYILDDEERFALRAIADINADLLEEVANHYHIKSRYTDYRILLDREDIEAVVICHSGSHRDSVLAALNRGKDVFVEKPLAWNVRETQEIVAHVQRGDRIVQVGYHKLYDPAFPVAKQYVEKIEDLGYVRICILHPAAEYGFSHFRVRRGKGVIQEGHKDPGTWTKQLEAHIQGLAEGALAALVDEVLGARKENLQLRHFLGTLNLSLIHSIYMMYGFLGQPSRIRSVELWRDAMSMQILVEYTPQLCCCLEWHHLPYLKDWREEYSFYGNRSRVSLQFPAPYFLHSPSPLFVHGCDGELTWEKKILVSYDEAYRRELREFHRSVLQRSQPMANVYEALKHTQFIQEVIDAVCLER